jgi:hypothetical protein
MSCNRQPEITENIICAKVCYIKFNDEPFARLSFEDFKLTNISEFFDSQTNLRKARWKLYIGTQLLYTFGWGNLTDVIPELSNGSTYNELVLGLNNSDIIAFISSFPSTIIPLGMKFSISLEVKDSMGIQNLNNSNKYFFTT